VKGIKVCSNEGDNLSPRGELKYTNKLKKSSEKPEGQIKSN
jgi:hypothetical protein